MAHPAALSIEQDAHEENRHELHDKVKSGFDKTKDGLSDFAETTRIKHEISTLADRKECVVHPRLAIARTRCTLGHRVAEFEAQCSEERFVRINTETGAALGTDVTSNKGVGS